MSDIYQAPSSQLTQSAATDYGSLERGIAGDYEFTIGDTLSEAWSKVSGKKLTVFLAALLYFIFLMVITFPLQFALGALGYLSEGVPTSTGVAASFVVQLIVMALTLPLAAGFMMMGIKGSVDEPISPGMIFQYYGKTLPLLVTNLLMMFLCLIGYLLLILPGLYLTFAYVLAIPLVVDRGLGPWQALETSRKAVTKRWFSVFFLMIILGVLMVLAVIPLGIGMIWVGPLMMLSLGILYRNVFGVESVSK
ncbi:MAG: hypothetical protein WDZ30_03560 [Cellvibrionaceae bacterium]